MASIPLARFGSACIAARAVGQEPRKQDLTSLPIEGLMRIEVVSDSKSFSALKRGPVALPVSSGEELCRFVRRRLSHILRGIPGLQAAFRNLPRFLSRLAALSILAALPHPEAGAQGSTSESFVKAAFVFHFAEFVEWPDNAFPHSGSPIIIGALGSQTMVHALESTVDGKTAHGRRLVVKSLGSNPAGERIHILFVGSGADFRDAALSGYRDKPVLLVGESPGFARRGGHLNLLIQQGKVAFELNLGAAKASRLAISAKLVRLAKAVIS